MRLLVFLVVLLLSSLACAQAAVHEIVEPYLFPNEPYSAQEFEQNGMAYIAVVVDGEYALLFENESKEYELVTGVERVYEILSEWKLGALGIDGRVDLVKESIANFNFSREPNERLCRQYVGLVIVHPDRIEEKPCFYNASASQPVESCLLACRTVPICSTGLSNDLPAIYSILYFHNASKEMDSNVTALLANIEEVRSIDASAAERASANLDNIVAAKGRIASNNLFTTYAFCNPITFNETALTAASTSIATVMGDLEYIAGLHTVSERVVSFTNSRLALLTAEQTYEKLLENATARMSDVRDRVNDVLEIVDDPFTRETLGVAEYSYYVLSNAVNAKDYRAADNAYYTFVASAENAENAADRLEKRVENARRFLENCADTVHTLEEHDVAGEYLKNTSRLFVRLGALEAQFNNTPMSTDYLTSLEEGIAGTCAEAGSILKLFASEIFSEKLAKINSNLDFARSAFEARGLELNDTEVMGLLAQANESIRLGNLDAANDFYRAALKASEELVKEAEELNAEVEEAELAIGEAEEMLASIRGSIGYMILNPDLSEVEDMLDEAKSILNSDPARAKELAEDAMDSMAGTAGMTSLITYALFGALLLFMFFIAIAVLLVVYLRKRAAAKRASDENAKSEAKGTVEKKKR